VFAEYQKPHVFAEEMLESLKLAPAFHSSNRADVVAPCEIALQLSRCCRHAVGSFDQAVPRKTFVKGSVTREFLCRMTVGP